MSKHKTFILGLLSTYGLNFISVVSGFVFVPLGLNYFGSSRYGIWVLILSLIGYLGISNVGIGTASSVLIAKASNAHDQWRLIKKSLYLLVISCAIVIFLLISAYFLNLENLLSFLKIPREIQHEAVDAILAGAVLFLVNMPLTVFYSGLFGMQKVYWEKFYSSLTIIAGLIAIFLTILFKGNLVTFVVIRGILIILNSVVCIMHTYSINLTERLKVSDSLEPKDVTSKDILSTSARFFVIGIAGMVIWNTDNIIISHFVGLNALASYSVTFKLIMTFPIIFMAINSTLMPMYGKYSTLMQWDWIERSYNRSIRLLSIIGGAIWLTSIAFSKPIIELWIGTTGYAGDLVAFSLGGYCFLLSLINAHYNLISGINEIKGIAYFGWIEALINLGASILLVKFFGTGGVALGTFIGALLASSWILPLAIHKKTLGKVKFDYSPVIGQVLKILIPFLLAIIFLNVFWADTISRYAIASVLIICYFLISWKNISLELRTSLAETFKMYLAKTKGILING